MLFPLISTSRLVLRQVVAGDAPAIFSLYADREHIQARLCMNDARYPQFKATAARLQRIASFERAGMARNARTKYPPKASRSAGRYQDAIGPGRQKSVRSIKIHAALDHRVYSRPRATGADPAVEQPTTCRRGASADRPQRMWCLRD